MTGFCAAVTRHGLADLTYFRAKIKDKSMRAGNPSARRNVLPMNVQWDLMDGRDVDNLDCGAGHTMTWSSFVISTSLPAAII